MILKDLKEAPRHSYKNIFARARGALSIRNSETQHHRRARDIRKTKSPHAGWSMHAMLN
jgi:hypothetical protein